MACASARRIAGRDYKFFPVVFYTAGVIFLFHITTLHLFLRHASVAMSSKSSHVVYLKMFLILALQSVGIIPVHCAGRFQPAFFIIIHLIFNDINNFYQTGNLNDLHTCLHLYNHKIIRFILFSFLII